MSRGRQALLAGAVVLFVHGSVALLHPLPSAFAKYSTAAELHLRGELAAERLADFSPFYFRLWLAAERLLGEPERWIAALQVLLAAVLVGLFYLVARRRLPAFLAGGAVVVLALDRHLLVYERVFEPEVWQLAFLLAFLAAIERPGGRWALAAGAAAALSLATRPSLLPLFALVPIYLWFHRGPRHGWLRPALLFALPCLAMLALLAARSARITGDWRTPTMNPGTVFFEGNNALSLGTSAVYPPAVRAFLPQDRTLPDSSHQRYRDVARAAAGRPLTVAEVNAYWSGLARDFIRAEPGRFLRLELGKLHFAFHGFRWHDVPAAWRYDAILRLSSVPFSALAALALLGLLFTARHWRRDLLLYAVAANQLAVMLVFYVSARQRLALVPVLVLFAALAAEHLRKSWREGEKGRAAAWLALAALLALALALPTGAIRDERHRRLGVLRGEALYQQAVAAVPAEPAAWHTSRVAEAIAAVPWHLELMRPAYLSQEAGSFLERVRQGVARREPKTAGDRFDLAVLSLELGHAGEARALLEGLVADGDELYRGSLQAWEPLFYLGRARALEGDREAALGLLHRALERAPGDPYVLAELSVLTGDPRWQAQLERFWGLIDARYLEGQSLLAHSRPREAAERFAEVIARLGDLRPARIHLAAALGEAGALDEGARSYLAAMRHGVEPVLREREIVALFRAWAERHRERSEARLTAARVLHQYGYLSEALALTGGLEDVPGVEERARTEQDELRRALERAN